LFGCGFVEEGFAVALDRLLVFLADLGGIGHAVLFVVAFDELLGRLWLLARLGSQGRGRRTSLANRLRWTLGILCLYWSTIGLM
jgi:hypothetical protein